MDQDSSLKKEIIGLVPAGGSAVRLSPLPCSKEILPVGFYQPELKSTVRPKVAAHYLLENIQAAGAQKAFIILRRGKWDIPAYFGDGQIVGLPLGYLMMELPFGVPFTLDQAYSFVRDSTILFGFPDILFEPSDAFIRLLNRRSGTRANVVLGLFPAHQPHKMDMVELDPDGRILQIIIKPVRTHLRYTWIIAVWDGLFTEFMHDFVSTRKKIQLEKRRPSETHLGEVIQAAIQEKLKIAYVIFNEGKYVDIGTPEDLVAAVNTWTSPRFEKIL